MLQWLRSNYLELTAVIVCTIVFAAWNACATHAISLPVLVFFFFFNVACFLAGGLILRLLAWEIPGGDDLASRFLVGFFAVNSVLAISLLSLPFHAGGTAAVVLATAILVGLIGRMWRRSAASQGGRQRVGILCIAISLLGATTWSRDALDCEVPAGETTVFRPFGDSFIHAYFLSRMSFPETPRDNAQMAGTPMGPYHFGSYATPAVLTRISGTTAYEAFNSFQVPAGLFLAGLAAFLLAKTWWGAWPGVAAAAVIFLPDGAWLGLQNYWFSYHWLGQIAPGGTFGVAWIAVCWVMMFRGCQTGRNGLLLASFFGLALCIFYKAHIFVANAFLLWLYPALFMTAWSRKRRVLWACFAIVTYVAAVYVGQLSGRVPTMRFDGSALAVYMPILASRIELEHVRAVFTRFACASPIKLHDLCFDALMVWSCTFGVFGIAWIALAAWLRKRMDWRTWLFPCFITANYLVMALGLSFDKNKLAEPEELLHRPFIWAYFVIAVWVAGAAYYAFFKNKPPDRVVVRVAMAGSFLALLAVPLCANRIVHQGPAEEWTAAYCRIPIPTGLVDSCRYVWRQSDPIEVIQDSQTDPRLRVSGLTGRRSFAAGYKVARSQELQRRIEKMKAWESMTDESEIRAFAANCGIHWLIVHPGDMSRWPAGIMGRPTFESGDFRVYHFAPGS
jgi:hypothetical protein